MRYLITIIAVIVFPLSITSAFADDKPVAQPKHFCEPQLVLAQTHLEKMTRERNGLAMNSTSLELHIQYLERRIVDLTKKLDEAKKAVSPDAGPAADDKK